MRCLLPVALSTGASCISLPACPPLFCCAHVQHVRRRMVCTRLPSGRALLETSIHTAFALSSQWDAPEKSKDGCMLTRHVYSVPAGIYANMLLGNPTAVSKYFGTAMYSVTNIIFITESLSTLDSTFTSAAKLLGPEFLGILEEGRPQPPQSATKR